MGVCGKTNRTKIVNVQRRAVKLLDKLPADLRHHLPFDLIYQYNSLVHFHKVLVGNELDNHFYNRINILFPNHAYSPDLLKKFILLPALRQSVSKKQFSFKVIKE